MGYSGTLGYHAEELRSRLDTRRGESVAQVLKQAFNFEVIANASDASGGSPADTMLLPVELVERARQASTHRLSSRMAQPMVCCPPGSRLTFRFR
ncbi:MAG: hypothetical protein R3C26_06050 [Calditrichia bacterium]